MRERRPEDRSSFAVLFTCVLMWKRLTLNGLAFLGIGGYISYGIGLSQAKGHDIPRELLACYPLFVFACASPGFLLPYGWLSTKLYPDARGLVTALVSGALYPFALFGLNAFLIKMLGYDDAGFDRLAESFLGWFLLILITLGPGIILSFLGIKLEVMLNRE